MKNKTLLLNSILIIALSAFFQLAKAQSPCILSQRTIGGTSYDASGDWPHMLAATDGDFVCCGTTASVDGDFTINHGGMDAFIIKFNSAGETVWSHTYGGSNDEVFHSLVQTNDGGFIAAGSTSSTDGDVNGNHGSDDVWVVKVDKNGIIQWQKCYGGTADDVAYISIPISNGGYAFAGATYSIDGDVTSNHGDRDVWFVQINSVGDITSSQTYGGTAEDYAADLTQLANGKFIIVGGTLSNDGDFTGNHGGRDMFVMRLNKNKTINWKQLFGGSGDEFAGGMIRSTDGNIIVGAGSNSQDGDVAGNLGNFVSWLIKIKADNGHIIWNKSLTISGLKDDVCWGLSSSSDGGCYSQGAAGDANDFTNVDAVAFKLDASGNILWEKTFGGSDFDYMLSSAENAVGVSFYGATNSSDVDVIGQHGSGDGWIVTLGSCERDAEMSKSESGSAIQFFVSPVPFTYSTTVLFSLPQSQNVCLKIFDAHGRLIRTLANDIMTAGSHELTWDAQDENGNAVSAGVYLLQLSTPEKSETIQLSVIK